MLKFIIIKKNLHIFLTVISIFTICQSGFSHYLKTYGYSKDQRLNYLYRTILNNSKPYLKEDTCLRKSMEIINDVGVGNYEDIHNLLAILRKQYPHARTNLHLPDELIVRVVNRIKRDKLLLAEYKEIIDGQTKWSTKHLPLRTSLVKLIGNNDQDSIFLSSIRLLQTSVINFKTGKIDGEVPANNKITTLKCGLLYLILESKGLKNFQALKKEFPNPKLFYPAKLPLNVEFAENIKDCSLYDESASNVPLLQIPNAGYIFGAILLDGHVKGIDCSAFTSYVTNCCSRLITEQQELIWRQKTGKLSKLFDRPRFISFQKSPAFCALQEYDAIEIENNPNAIRRSDLIVWRTPMVNSKSGHVVIFLDWIDREEKLMAVIDATRGNENQTEGVGVRIIPFEKPGYRIFGLRRNSIGNAKETT